MVTVEMNLMGVAAFCIISLQTLMQVGNGCGWQQVPRQQDTALYICNRHFSRECYYNYMLGFEGSGFKGDLVFIHGKI